MWGIGRVGADVRDSRHSGMKDRDSARGHAMFVTSGLERGGAERQLVIVANALAQRGWKVTVLSFLPFSETSLRVELDEPGVSLISLNARGDVSKLAGVARAVAMVRRVRPDVLVGFMFHGIMTARVAGRFAGTPAVVSAVRNEAHGRARERAMAATGWMTDSVTVMSDGLASRIAERGVASPSRLAVIPNAVDFERFGAGGRRDRTRQKLGVGAGEFLWLAAGRLAEAKDYPGLLRAFSVVADRRRVLLLIAGDGPLRGKLARLVDDLGLAGPVRLLGLRDDLPELYLASDSLVLSSAWEGMPNVVLEAMASGTPVVATAVGAAPEMVEDGETGFVVAPGDHAALAGAMKRMMDLAPEERRAMGETGRRAVRSRHSVDSVVDRWEELFGRLLEGKRHGRGAPGR